MLVWNIHLEHLDSDALIPIQLIVTPNNINAAGIVVQYWTQKVHIAIWMGAPIFS